MHIPGLIFRAWVRAWILQRELGKNSQQHSNSPTKWGLPFPQAGPRVVWCSYFADQMMALKSFFKYKVATMTYIFVQLSQSCMQSVHQPSPVKAVLVGSELLDVGDSQEGGQPLPTGGRVCVHRRKIGCAVWLQKSVTWIIVVFFHFSFKTASNKSVGLPTKGVMSHRVEDWVKGSVVVNSCCGWQGWNSKLVLLGTNLQVFFLNLTWKRWLTATACGW